MGTTRKRSATKSRAHGGARLTTSKFLALPNAEKERIYREIDGKTTRQLVAESQPLPERLRSRWAKIKKNLGGRPKLGKFGTEIVSVTVEKDLLKRADAFAKAKGIKRSQLFSEGLRLIMRGHAA